MDNNIFFVLKNMENKSILSICYLIWHSIELLQSITIVETHMKKKSQFSPSLLDALHCFTGGVRFPFSFVIFAYPSNLFPILSFSIYLFFFCRVTNSVRSFVNV